MEHLTELYLFVRYTIQQYSQQIKDLSVEELQALTLILTTPISKSGWIYESQKAMLIDNHSTYTSALWSAISLCEDLMLEIKSREDYGENCYKSEKQLENLISYLKEIRTKLTQNITLNMV